MNTSDLTKCAYADIYFATRASTTNTSASLATIRVLLAIGRDCDINVRIANATEVFARGLIEPLDAVCV